MEHELQPVIVTASEVKREQVRWLWPRRVPLAKVTVLDGDPDLGKSTFTIDLASRVSTASLMPDGTRNETFYKGVVIINGEDGLADTMVPRLEAAGADQTEVHFLDGVNYTTDEGRLCQKGVAVPSDLSAIEQAVESRDAALVIIDPLAAFLDEAINSFRDQDVRRALFPLARLAERTGAAIMLVRHLNKGSGGNPLYRGGGSIGIIGAARAGLLIAQHPEDETKRIIAVSKNNLSAKPPSLVFRLVPDELYDCARISWEGPCRYRANDLLEPPREAEEAAGALGDATEFLRQVLRDGDQWVKTVRDEARAAAVAWRTAERAKALLHVSAVKVGKPGDKEQGWKWHLPPGQ